MITLLSNSGYYMIPILIIAIIWSTSIWVFIDIKSNELDIKPPYVDDTFNSFTWFFSIHFFPILFIPIYLYERNKVIKLNLFKVFDFYKVKRSV